MPSKKQIEEENKRELSEKLGVELDQGVFLSSILSDSKNGNHLCETMLKPSKLALANLDKFNSTGHLNFGKASIKLNNNFI